MFDGSQLRIGPSTGWLYANEMYSLHLQECLLKETAANCVETCLARWDRGDKRLLSIYPGSAFDVSKFSYRSIHLPVIETRDSVYIVSEAIRVSRDLEAATAVTHPAKTHGEYPEWIYERMVAVGVPLALENMDSTKDSGYLLSDLECLVKKSKCKFVLDAQHAFEHDPSMKYADDLLATFVSELSHLHVSGQAGQNVHSLVCRATNAKQILAFVSRVLSVKSVPLILEGEYSTAEEINEEIQFITRELCST